MVLGKPAAETETYGLPSIPLASRRDGQEARASIPKKDLSFLRPNAARERTKHKLADPNCFSTGRPFPLNALLENTKSR